ncbi:hypothetical protein BDM02DRAFT_3260112 [Thelephora ganbajun]|uniref:Uncharacterized protein n=1 Tax=Thelephora ganbajun TaxID=370292 RepID=A0ACB6ZJ75_THEGA|nr:hypothetical protein BDM02DRAFT_3260112 [Thelephora ganbajun]
MLAADQPPQRADSLRSVESAVSSTPFSRKPRMTRPRSRSATPDTRRSFSLSGDANGSMSDELFTSYSTLKSRSVGHSPPNSPDLNLPPSAQSSFPFLFSTLAQRRPSSAEPTVPPPEPPHPRGRHQILGPSKIQASRRPRSVPRRAMGSISSDSSRGPPTPVEFSMSRPAHRDRLRDSLQSGTSSSLYPASTHTSSPMDRALSPQSHFEQMPEVVEVPTLAENESGYRDFDTDDVSLRLRLLVNNSYFLPPAHSKPTIADLSNHDAAKRTPKPAAPGFFDIFRIGKVKPKPPTPVALERPRLRATSESTTQLHVPPYTEPTPGPSATPHQSVEIQARVMVVREKMEDLMIVAKQAEQESKIRAERLAELQERNLDQTERFDGIIDPTDAVDLPPPSTKYPFAIQASAIQGLGVHDSIGAAVLADRLPPPRSPGLWSVTEEDEKWRKLLLTQAVGHSLSNTPDSWASRTPIRRPPRSDSIPTTTPRSLLSPTPQSPSSPTPQTQTLLSEPILLPDALRKRIQHSPSLSHLTPSPKSQAPHLDRKGSVPDMHNVSKLSPPLGSSYDPPVRAETPVVPTFPLPPAPRTTTTGPGIPGVKQLINPIYSLSQSDLGDDGETGVGSPSSSPTPSSGDDQTSGPSFQEILSGKHEGEELRTVQSILAQAAQTAQSTRLMKSARSIRSLRQSATSEKLPDVRENGAGVGNGRSLMSLPPSIPPVTVESAAVSPRHTLGVDSEVGTSSQFDEEDTEEWFGLHDDSGSRDSSGAFPRTRSMVSYLAPPSPTVSAFYDALEGRDSESSPAGPDTDVGTSSGPETFVTADARGSVYSPPPRQSTSIAPQPLPPPPRRRPRTGPSPRRPSTLRQEPITIWEPEPSSPPLPSLTGERRGTGFSLDIPSLPERGELSRAVAEEAALGDATRMSISFFDSIQGDLNELDGSSSSEEESDAGSDPEGAFEVPVFRNPDTQAISIPGRRSISSTTTRPARPTFMRLGNNSTPQFGSSTSSASSFNQMRNDYPVFDPTLFRGPVGNTPTTPTTKSSFFTSRTPKKQKQQGVSSEDYHDPMVRSFEDRVGAGPSTSCAGSTFLDMESERAPSASSHESQETEETGKLQDESTKLLDGLVLQHLEKERDTIKRITESNRAAKSRP